MDCAGHGVWSEPKGWTALHIEDATFVTDPGRRVVLAHVLGPPRDLDPARELASRIAGTTLEWTRVSEERLNRWRTITAELGEGTLDGGVSVTARIEHGHPAVAFGLPIVPRHPLRRRPAAAAVRD